MENVNTKMHMGMMNLVYTGDADVDFARGMIPHHMGAVDMCNVLIDDLTCTERSDIDNLEGLAHFCSHVQFEQEIEVGGLRNWLQERGLNDTAPCPTAQMRSTMMAMPESCGFTDTPQSQAYIELNHKMHDLMAVEYSCNHSVDFVRMMISHHAAAIEMCDIVLETTMDDFLNNLCANITLTQRAEIAWMHDWLTSRDYAVTSPCGDCTAVEIDPCEDLLSTSSFCHGLGVQPDGYCKCAETLQGNLTCESPSYVEGVGLFEPQNLCQRSCGQCPSEIERLIWPVECSASDGHHGGSMNGTNQGSSAATTRSYVDAALLLALGLSLVW